MTDEHPHSYDTKGENPLFGRLRNFGWLSGEDMCRIAIGFLITLVLAKYLGPERFGALGYITSIVALLMPFTVFGLDTIVLRQCIAQPKSAGSVLGSSLAIRLIGSIVAIGLALAFFAILESPDGTSMYLLAIAAIALTAAPWQSFNLYFKAQERVAILAIPRMAIVIGAAVTLIVLMNEGYGLQSIIWLKTLETVAMGLVAVGTFGLLARNQIELKIEPAQIVTLARQGLPLFLSAIAIIIYMRVDQIMLGNMASIMELGNYSLAVRFSEAAFFIPMALQTAFYPALVRAKQLSENKFKFELRRYFDLVSGIMMALIIFVGIASHAIIVLTLGDEYAGAVPMVWILTAALPFVGLGIARTAYLTIEGKLWVAPIATLIGATANVALNFLLIPKYGGTGAAIASVISYWLAAHGTCYILPSLSAIGQDISRALNPFGVVYRTVPPLIAFVTSRRT